MPGIFGCIDSCKTWSGGCFYPIDACHFYGVYANPKSPNFLEVFKCVEFQKELKFKITLRSSEEKAEKQKKSGLLK